MLARGAGPAPEGGHVVAAPVGLRAARAERAAPRVDDLRVHRADVVDVDPELLARAGQEAGQEHVRPAGQLVEHLRALGHRHVQADAALAPVGVLDVGVRVALDPNAPVCRSPRCGSPVTACSTLITSAPQSASTAPADGTKPYIATSRTRIPPAASCRPPGRRDGEGLALQELLQPGDAHLPADARLLVTAERRCPGRSSCRR